MSTFFVVVGFLLLILIFRILILKQFIIHDCVFENLLFGWGDELGLRMSKLQVVLFFLILLGFNKGIELFL
jgi:hypothetical protein